MITVNQKDIKGQIVKDSNYQFVLLKTHKLASALYAVTHFMSDMDPLKWQLRDKSLTLLSDIAAGNVDQALWLIDQAISFIDIALLAQTASEMNFSILKREYLSLKEFISASQLGQVAELKQLPRPPLSAGEMALKTGQFTTPFPPPNQRLNSRQGFILAFIKEKGASSTKEVVRAVPNFSSKTVQRDLVQMVRLGILTKEGRRRWRCYRALV